jgi:Ca2+-binding RTX toxin-like protein
MNFYGTVGTDYLSGTAGSDMLAGFGGTDFLFGGDGNDLFIGGAGADVLVGNSIFTLGTSTDWDLAAYWDSPTGVVVDLTLGRGWLGTAEGDTLYDIEGLWGSEFADTLVGNAANNELEGAGGNDILAGLDGNDELHGGFGDDILLPGSGRDIVNGGDGNDTVEYSDGTAPVFASLLYGGITGDAAGDTYLSIENVIGTPYDDFLQGNTEDNTLRGRQGNDYLSGEDGNDTLVGGTGTDILAGGAGADTFVWLSPSETGATIATADLIWDFESSVDRIDLQQIDAITKTEGNQSFEFIGMADFTAPGQVRWSIEGSETVVWINVDGDLAADAAIRLAGAPLLGSDNFLL